ncbi:Carbohydrate-binding domain-containing protein Cthe_2159 [Propionibacterium ruminifibrarum]|uniref:Carbohydrate-binding domain-containing protein Cthe_2159 n=1 Tax=Propionibacterium ruminifibrarum TaxID=1962131 RepID=A0A375I1E9_9ACTN|nr:carbohydrate-binding domain-containing protein [Propionibacterium ruminifibrarum]SPF67220.1 Carbohydrate-binding domain-containing protein Cthe_2159 [Propionibacterium ruminifibrarum]
MISWKKTLAGLAVAASLVGCSAATDPAATSTSAPTTAGGGEAAGGAATTAGGEQATASSLISNNKGSHYDEADTEYDESAVVTITLSGASASGGGDGVTIDGSTVTITRVGTYRISGTLDDGRIIVNSTGEGEVRLILDGAEITSSTGPALLVEEADETVVLLADDSVNRLTDGSGYDTSADGAANAALHSKDDLTISGQGALDVTGRTADGITSTDGLVIDSGTITVTAVDDGIRGKDYLIVQGGTVRVTSGGDGLTSDNEEDTTRGYVQIDDGALTIDAGGDGVAAITDVIQTGGTTTITAGSGTAADDEASTKGVKAGVAVSLADGTVTIDSSDDALHSDDVVQIDGGTIDLASGDDGVHAENALLVNGGAVTVSTSYEGFEANDITINDGTVEVTSSDDGMNASDGSGTSQDPMATTDSTLTIAGGTVTITADGDGLDSNGDMVISGGTTVINGPSSGDNGALDVGTSLQITGGTLFAAGSQGMAESPDADSPQGWVQASADGRAGSTVTISDESGTEIASYTLARAAQNIIVSSPAMTPGGTYTVSVDGTSTNVVANQSSGGAMGPGGGGMAPGNDGGMGPGGAAPSRR